MSIELLLKDFGRLEALAKKADESLHIGKTAISQRKRQTGIMSLNLSTTKYPTVP